MKIKTVFMLILIVISTFLFGYQKELNSVIKLIEDGYKNLDYEILNDARLTLIELSESDSLNVSLYINLANVDILIAEWNEIKEDMQTGIDKFPNDSDIGSLYLMLGISAVILDEKNPKDYFEKALEAFYMNPDDADSKINIPLTLHYLGRNEEALNFIEDQKNNGMNQSSYNKLLSMLTYPVEKALKRYYDMRGKVIKGNGN